jgi:ABC-type microcin C transport system duplicated ATPase subunit YejF
MISKQQFEAQLQQIFRLLLENKTQEEIAHELNISTRTVARYSQRIDQRYGQVQRQKNDDTLFLECHLFKNRMLNLYKALENKVFDEKTSGIEKAKCAEVAANIAIDVLKMESEGIRAVKELGSAANTTASLGVVNKNNTNLNNNNLRNNENDDYDYGPYHSRNNQKEQEENNNRKF